MSGKNSLIFRIFIRHNFNKSLWKNIFLSSSHSRPSPLVRAPPHLTLFPLPNTFLLCPFLSASPSSAAPFSRYTISNAFNARSASWIILAKEGVPISESHIHFSPRVISLGVDKMKHKFLSSSVVFSPSTMEWLKTQWKRKDCKMSLLRLLSNGMNSGLLPTGQPE